MFSCVSLALCGPDTFSYNGFVPCTSCSDDQYQLYYGATTCLPCTENISSKIGKCKKDKQQSSSFDQSKENLQHYFTYNVYFSLCLAIDETEVGTATSTIINVPSSPQDSPEVSAVNYMVCNVSIMYCKVYPT